MQPPPPDPFWPALADSPLVSVIVPACNCANFLEDTLQSIVDQEYPQLEILVIDDGSTDDTAAVARHFQGPVKLLETARTHSGAGASRNVGLRASQGDLIAFLDGDDVWLPGKLKNQIECFRAHPECAMVASDFHLWHPDDNGQWSSATPSLANASGPTPTRLDPARSGWIYHKLLMDTIVWTGAVVMRRELVKALGQFREDLRLAQDYEYWIRASRITPICTLAAPLALYRRHPNSATKRWAPVNYALKVVDEAVTVWGLSGPDGSKISNLDLRRRRFGLHFSMGYQLFWNNQKAKSFSSFFLAVWNRPLHLRAWIYTILSAIYWPSEFSRSYLRSATRASGNTK